MSFKKQYIEWSVPISEVQIGVPIGYEVEFSLNSNLQPVTYYLNTFKENGLSFPYCFYYSLDNGVTWIDFPLGEYGYAFSTAYKMRLEISVSYFNFIYVSSGSTVYQISGDGNSINDSYIFPETIKSLDFDKYSNKLVVMGEQTVYFVNGNTMTFSQSCGSINLQSEALGIILDSGRQVLWQVDRDKVYLKDLYGEILWSKDIPEIEIDYSSSSSSSSMDSSSSSSSSSIF